METMPPQISPTHFCQICQEQYNNDTELQIIDQVVTEQTFSITIHPLNIWLDTIENTSTGF